ncbi:MAG TPA: hypothetical protein VLC12_05970, partial [Terriglobales bacterium]|nr:hypothetical protein [Terriglobales bacterium]
MIRSRIQGGLAVLFAAAALAAAQTSPELRTADTVLRFAAGANAPLLTSLQPAGQQAWTNRTGETLIDHVEADGQALPVRWQFNRAASHSSARGVAFVYDSASPRLRLTWEWKARAAQGPIEHQITIQNLGSRELWLPMQDSLRFDWRVSPQAGLRETYVEKGAGTPSTVGTHDVDVPEGYTWEGTSSTYARPEKGGPREIIPWMLVQQAAGTQSGWYAGIEFSGRTRLALSRNGDSLQGAAGLNPDPGPFRTRLRPGESFATPLVFVGAFHGGADSAGNILRRWVRDVLGNPGTWKNPDYPVLVNNSWGSGMQIDQALA